MIHVAALRLAFLAGWPDQTMLTELRDRLIANGLEYRWSSSWKASPDRRHKARVTYRQDDDGLGRMRVEVTDGTIVRATPESYAPRGFRHVASRLRWDGSDVVTFESYNGRWEATSDRAHLSELPVVGDDVVPPIDPKVRHPSAFVYETPAPVTNRIRAGSSGRDYLTPLDFFSVVDQLVDSLNADDWQAWWAPAQLGDLRVEFEMFAHVEAQKLFVRKTADGVTARVTLPHPPPGVDPVAVGHEAVLALMDRVRPCWSPCSPASTPSRGRLGLRRRGGTA